MYKKLLLILLGIFFLFILILFFICLNLNYFLNNSKIKKNLLSFLKSHYKIELSYEKISVNLSKTKIFTKNLNFKFRNYEGRIPEGYFTFSLKKLLKLNFYPTKVFIPNAYLKISPSRKPFKLKNFINTLSKLPSFYLNTKDLVLEYKTPLGWITFFPLNIKCRTDKSQLLYQIDTKTQIFENAEIKGRFNYKKLFLDTSLNIKNLNASKLRTVSKYGILKTSLDLKSHIVFEKNTFNIAFLIYHPYVLFKKAYSQEFKGKYIEGLAIIKDGEIQIHVEPIILNKPYLKAKLTFEKKELNKYKLQAKIEKTNINQINKLLTNLFPHKENIKKLFQIVKRGDVYKLTIGGKGNNIKDIFKPEHLYLKASLSKGKIEILSLPFYFENIEGNFIYSQRILNFEGKTIGDKKIPFYVKKLSLDFNKKPSFLFIKGEFFSEAENLKNTIIKLSKTASILNKYNFQGKLKGDLKLSGHIPHIKGYINLSLKDLNILTSYFEEPIVIKNGILTYNFDSLKVKNLKVYVKNSYIHNADFYLKLKTSDFSFLIKNAYISKEFIHKISLKYPQFQKIFSKYKISLDSINIDYLKYESNLKFFKEKIKKEEILKNLFVKGYINKLNLKFPYKNTVLNLKAKCIPFNYSQNSLNISNTLVYLEDSPFLIKNLRFENGIFLVEGSGETKRILKTKFEKILNLPKNVSLKTPIKFEHFQIKYLQNETIYYGKHSISNIEFNLVINATQNVCQGNLDILEKNTDLKIKFKRSPQSLNIFAKGEIDLNEFSQIFDRKLNISGNIKTFLDVSFPKNLHLKNLDELANFYLNFNIFNKDSFIKVTNLVYTDKKLDIFINFLGNFTNKNIKISNILIKWNNSTLKGFFEIAKKEKYLYLKGSLSGKKANFSHFGAKSKSSKFKKDIFLVLNKIPLKADLDIKVSSLLLPRSYHINNVKADIKLDNMIKTLEVKSSHLKFCGLSFDVSYKKENKKQFLLIKLLPSQGDFLDLVSCLYPEEMPKVILEGPYKIEGYFYAEGNNHTLFKKSIGEIKIRGKKGYLYRAPLLARLFAFISPIDLFRGKVPNLESKLLEYDELYIESLVENFNLKIETGFLSAIGFRLFGEGNVNLKNKKLDLTFYASPFKTLDVVVEKFPYLGKKILGKQRMFVYLPLKVTGTYEKYNIIPLHPSSVGKGIFNFIFRIFGSPEVLYKKSDQFEKFEKRELLEKEHEKLKKLP